MHKTKKCCFKLYRKSVKIQVLGGMVRHLQFSWVEIFASAHQRGCRSSHTQSWIWIRAQCTKRNCDMEIMNSDLPRNNLRWFQI